MVSRVWDGIRRANESVALIVQKYGGTSLGSVELIHAAAKRVCRAARAGNRVVVVLSAMAGVTDALVKFGEVFCGGKSDDPAILRERDVLHSIGEHNTVAAMAMALNCAGVRARSLLGHQIPIVTDETYSNAVIREIHAQAVVTWLDRGYVVVVPGFQGVTTSGDVTTLGRGGSDTTAVALAAALKADLCEIYTDVDGVYTADPNICPNARLLKRLSYEETLEMASLGAKVLQTRSVFFAMKYRVPVHVRSSFNDEEGTMVVEEESSMESRVVAGVACDKNEAKVSVLGIPDKAGIAAAIFKPLADAGIVVDMIVQSIERNGTTTLSFTIMKKDYQRAMNILKANQKEFGAERIEGELAVAKVSIIGAGMRTHTGVASLMFEALGREHINIRLISTSEIKISCLIDEKYTELAVRVLHDVFGLNGGVGTV